MKILSSKWMLIGLTAANVCFGSAAFAAQTDVPAKSPTAQTEEDQKVDDEATKKVEEAQK